MEIYWLEVAEGYRAGQRIDGWCRCIGIVLGGGGRRVPSWSEN
jgi:hypothetical protein